MPLFLSRRRRRVAITAGFFALFPLGVLLAMRGFTGGEGAYTPGGEIEGLTSKLARDAPADPPDVRFREVTREVGIDFRHFPGQRTQQLPEDMGSGAAWGDYDNDGWPDLFLVDIARPLPGGVLTGEKTFADAAGRSVLYRNLGDGTFRNVTEEAGIDHATVGMAATWADYDDDGWTDLFLTAFGDNVLYRNQGDGTFRDATLEAGLAHLPGFWTGAVWGDYDRDGHLDLYVTGYVRYSIGANFGVSDLQYEVEVPASLNPSTYRPHRNLLWHNQGDGTFLEVAARAGVANEQGRSLGATWADLDGDGWLDLYVANDVSDNALFRNRGDGTFEDISHRALVADYRGAMGLAVGDWDEDSDPDLFITHWIAQENALFSNRSADLAGATGPAKPLQFIDEADRFGLGQIALDFIGWGTSFFDYDNDGRLDLFVANGSTFQRREDPSLLEPMRDQLFWNRGPRDGFYDVSSNSGPYFAELNVGRGAAFADYDRDGDVDIVILNHNASPSLLRNDGGDRGDWLEVALEGRTRVGARVRAVAGGVSRTRWLGVQSSYLSQNSDVVHIGLGRTPSLDTLEITWPGGAVQVWTEMATRRAILVVEGQPTFRELWAPEPPPDASSRDAGPTKHEAGPPGGGDGAPASVTLDERARTLRFWELQRAATRARVAGELETAAARYASALELEPDHEDALYYLGGVRIELGDHEGSERTLRRLLAVNPRSGRGLGRLGALLACPRDGAVPDLEEAVRTFEAAWALNREQVGPPLWLGLAGLLRDDLDAANEHFDVVLGADETNIAAHLLRGYGDWQAGRSAAAADHLAAAVASAAATHGGEVGLGEGDTRGRRSLFAGALSCPWLEETLAEILSRASPEATDGGSPAAYAELDRRLREASAPQAPGTAGRGNGPVSGRGNGPASGRGNGPASSADLPATTLAVPPPGAANGTFRHSSKQSRHRTGAAQPPDPASHACFRATLPGRFASCPGKARRNHGSDG